MSRVKAGSESWKRQGRARAAHGQAEPGQVMTIPDQASSVLERNGHSGAKEQGQIKVREEDRIRTVVSRQG